MRADVSATAANLLPELIFRAGLALPQLAERPDGGVRIWWLGDGDQLTIEIDAQDASISATREVDGRKDTMFHHDIRGEVGALAADELAQVRAFLEGLGGPSVVVW